MNPETQTSAKALPNAFQPMDVTFANKGGPILFRQGYNACLEATSAAELLEACQDTLRRLRDRETGVGDLWQMETTLADAIIRATGATP